MKRYELMRASLVAQLVKNLPAMQNTLVWLVYYLVSCWLDTKCSFKIPTIYHYKECIKSKLFKSVKDSESIRLITTLENIPSIFKIYKTWSLIFSQLNNHPKSLNNFPKNGFSSAQLCLTLCDPLDCSMPGFPVDRQLPGFTQTHVHWVSEAIQPSQPLLFPSPLACNLSQRQGLFQWVALACPERSSKLGVGRWWWGSLCDLVKKVGGALDRSDTEEVLMWIWSKECWRLTGKAEKGSEYSLFYLKVWQGVAA